MLTGNDILLIFILLLIALALFAWASSFLTAKMLGKVLGSASNPATSRDKAQDLIIEVEDIDPNKTKGWGFVVDNRIVLDYNKTPLLFSDRNTALSCLRERFYGNGEVVFQKWDLDSQKVFIGTKVQKNGTD